MMEQWTQDDMKSHARGEHVPRKARLMPAPDELVIEIPLPGSACSPNARCHWSRKAREVKALREAACTAANIHLQLLNAAPPLWDRAEIEATFHKPSKLAKVADDDNLIDSLKGAFDGLQDAHIIHNDSGFIHLPPKQLLGKAAKGERKVVLVIKRREDV